MYEAKILSDYVADTHGLLPGRSRLTTYEVTFPRFILAEFNTHRVLSRNSASSRAIPPEKQIERVKRNPFVPVFNKRVAGMGGGDLLSEEEQRHAEDLWKSARNDAVSTAEMLILLDIDKARINRILEPFMWHTAIVTATEWDNFFGLRDNEQAQPEFREIAAMMRDLYHSSEPLYMSTWQDDRYTTPTWSMPLTSHDDSNALYNDHGLHTEREIIEARKALSASRCARVSYDRHTDTEPIEKTLSRAKMLRENRHLSPFEHVARPFTYDEWAAIAEAQEEVSKEMQLRPERRHQIIHELEFLGNFRGWVQMRKEIEDEDNYLQFLASNANPGITVSGS